MAIPPGGGGMSLGGRDPGPVMRGGGLFTLVAGGGPLDGTRGFSILKWNCKKNCMDKSGVMLSMSKVFTAIIMAGSGLNY